jgi:hypothetical protein
LIPEEPVQLQAVAVQQRSILSGQNKVAFAAAQVDSASMGRI